MTSLKITIITCTLNSARTIDECVASVAMQSYRETEHLFIDGGSTDDTVQRIKKYYLNPRIVVRPKQGVYDAFNAGLRAAKGDIVGFLHSDDYLADTEAMARVASAFISDLSLEYYCARLVVFDDRSREVIATLGSPPVAVQPFRALLRCTHDYAHPTYYCRRDVVAAVGNYDLRYAIAADVDWIHRLEKCATRFFFDERPLVMFRHSDSSASSHHFFKALWEESQIKQRHFGFSPARAIAYGYHFTRRAGKFILLRCGLHTVLAALRRRMNPNTVRRFV